MQHHVFHRIFLIDGRESAEDPHVIISALPPTGTSEAATVEGARLRAELQAEYDAGKLPGLTERQLHVALAHRRTFATIAMYVEDIGGNPDRWGLVHPKLRRKAGGEWPDHTTAPDWFQRRIEFIGFFGTAHQKRIIEAISARRTLTTTEAGNSNG